MSFQINTFLTILTPSMKDNMRMTLDLIKDIFKCVQFQKIQHLGEFTKIFLKKEHIKKPIYNHYILTYTIW